jgi:hypothetical protein
MSNEQNLSWTGNRNTATKALLPFPLSRSFRVSAARCLPRSDRSSSDYSKSTLTASVNSANSAKVRRPVKNHQ